MGEEDGSGQALATLHGAGHVVDVASLAVVGALVALVGHVGVRPRALRAIQASVLSEVEDRAGWAGLSAGRVCHRVEHCQVCALGARHLQGALVLGAGLALGGARNPVLCDLVKVGAWRGIETADGLVA